MARTKAVLGAGARLSDYLSASLLAEVYPAAMVGEILDEHSCNSKRIRSLPAVPGVYFCMALSLYPEAAYEHVFGVISQGLSWMQGKDADLTIAKSSISEMRSKIGAAPLQSLIERACPPLADAKLHPDAFYAGLRLVAIDGSNLEVADEADNVKAFGYPGSRTGHAGYPQAQCAILVECASHAVIAANLDAYRVRHNVQKAAMGIERRDRGAGDRLRAAKCRRGATPLPFADDLAGRESGTRFGIGNALSSALGGGGSV